MPKDTQSKSKLKGYIVLFILMAQLAVIASMIISFKARDYWWADIFNHFYPQYLFASLLTLAFAWFVRAKLLATIGVVSGIIAYTIIMHSLWIFPRSLPITHDDMAISEKIRIAQINYFYANYDYHDLAKIISDHDPDIINFQESSPAHSEYINKAYKDFYPYQVHQPRAGSYGTVIMSKLPITKQSVHIVNGGVFNNEIFDITVETGSGRDVRLLSLHTAQPLKGHKGTWQRNNELYAAAQIIRAHKGEKALLNNGIGDHDIPIMLIGDLNITPYSPFFRDIIRSTQQQFLGQGAYRFSPTWPAKIVFPLFQIHIDHILYDPMHISLDGWQIVDIKNSDHKAIIADFSFIQLNQNNNDQDL